MNWLTWLAITPWALCPPVFGAGYAFRWATKHPGGKVDRMLTHLFGRWT